MDSKNVVTVIIVIVASVLVVGVFVYFGGSRSAIESDLQVVLPAESAEVSRELLTALSSLRDLQLDPSFFEDRAFRSLIDRSGNLTDEQLGRDNPFLPVGGQGAGPATQP